MSDAPTEIIETPPPDALIPGPGAGIPVQPIDGPQPDQEPHFEEEYDAAVPDGRVGASVAWTATAALNKARSYLGFREGANNQNPFWDWPPRYRWLANAAYCASAQSYVAWHGGGQAGLAAVGGGHYNCAEWVNWGKAHGRFHSYTTTPQKGDLVMFDWNANHSYAEHVGILESYTPGYVTCIEFNTLSGNGGNQSDGGGCYRRTRSTKWVVGYVRPSYGASTNVTPISYKPTTSKITLAVDGDWGLNTTRRLQQYTGLPLTGVIDPSTRKALQRIVGVAQDGDWGPNTHKALQRLVKVTPDGVWGPATVKAFQRWLNAQPLRRTVAVTQPSSGGVFGAAFTFVGRYVSKSLAALLARILGSGQREA